MPQLYVHFMWLTMSDLKDQKKQNKTVSLGWRPLVSQF